MTQENAPAGVPIPRDEVWGVSEQDYAPGRLGPYVKERDGKIAVDLEDFQDPRKVFHHADRILELQTIGDTRPIHMTIGFTNYCNHKCPWCYINWNQAGKTSARSGADKINAEYADRFNVESAIISDVDSREKKPINVDDRYIEAIAEAKKLGLKSVTVVGDGEPTLHPRFPWLLERVAGLGLSIGLFTNFSTPRPQVIEAIAEHCFFARGSIDAASADVHSYSHGTGDFNRVISNISKLLDMRGAKATPHIGVQFVVNQHNWWQLPEAARFYRELGVDYLTIKPAYKNVLNPDHEENTVSNDAVFPLMREAQGFTTDKFKVYAKFPQFAEVVDYETNDARYYKKCNATPLSPYMDEDGNVEMCGNLKGRGFTMGNIYESSFEEIWHSKQRQDCLSRIDLYKCPAGCKLDPLNKVLWDALSPDLHTVHPDFI